MPVADVGPFFEQDPVEPFDLAVGLWPVGPGELRCDVVGFERFAPEPGSLAGTSGGVAFGEVFGRLDRSNRPSSPSSRNRSRHFVTVFASTWNFPAAASMVQPASITNRTILWRPIGVSDAFGCWVVALGIELSLRSRALSETHSFAPRAHLLEQTNDSVPPRTTYPVMTASAGSAASPPFCAAAARN